MSIKNPKNNEERVAKAIAHAIRRNWDYRNPSLLGTVAAKELKERGLIAADVETGKPS